MESITDNARISVGMLDRIIDECIEGSARLESGPYARDHGLWNIAQGTLAYMIRAQIARLIMDCDE